MFVLYSQMCIYRTLLMKKILLFFTFEDSTVGEKVCKRRRKEATIK